MQLHLQRDGQHFAQPLSVEEVNAQLAGGTVLATDMAWAEGMPNWVPVTQVPGVTDPVAASPAAGPALQLHLQRDGQHFAQPFSVEEVNTQLAGGTVLATDMAWAEGMPNWVPVTEVEGVKAPAPAAPAPPAFNPAAPPPQPAAPAPAPAPVDDPGATMVVKRPAKKTAPAPSPEVPAPAPPPPPAPAPAPIAAPPPTPAPAPMAAPPSAPAPAPMAAPPPAPAPASGAPPPMAAPPPAPGAPAAPPADDPGATMVRRKPGS